MCYICTLHMDILWCKTITVSDFTKKGTKKFNTFFQYTITTSVARLKPKHSWLSFETKEKNFPFYHWLFQVNLTWLVLIFFLKQIISIKYSLVLPRVCELSIAKTENIWKHLYFGPIIKTFCFCGYSFLLDSIWWLGNRAWMEQKWWGRKSGEVPEAGYGRNLGNWEISCH